MRLTLKRLWGIIQRWYVEGLIGERKITDKREKRRKEMEIRSTTDMVVLLNELKFGRPAWVQKLLRKWIEELKEAQAS